jgi:hypothetical protein
MQLVTISNQFNAAEAQLVRSRLEAAGFHPFLKDEIVGTLFEGYIMGAGGIGVQVPEDEAADAREFLEAKSE